MGNKHVTTESDSVAVNAKTETCTARRSLLRSALCTALLAGASALPEAIAKPSSSASDGAIKLVTLLHRKPGLTRDQFIERYESVHSKIGEKYLSGYATRYVRRFTKAVDSLSSPTPDQANSLPADVVMEIWFASEAHFHRCMTTLMSEEAQAEIVADELQMFDRSRMVSFLVDEYASSLPAPIPVSAISKER